ncbi:hypothetical protein F2P56_032977 [Juglans regia]|uniref:Uncharacterized protein LOC108980601 n=2 Tax=Juglans regia TaxID=51240 RepID=A0A2I4DIZ9_JUGRE|nr:uncharacterized protein LOC108980601 [Juglans regia]KAF5447423.1 hypothetical protein F2P56_032977 [Juglans regia]
MESHGGNSERGVPCEELRDYTSDRAEDENVGILIKEKAYESDPKNNTTKLDVARMSRLASYLGFPRFCCNESSGRKFWIFWKDIYDFGLVHISNQAVSGWLSLASYRIMVTFVYAKCTQLEHIRLWEELENVQVNESPWLVVGDFNTIRSDSEQIGANPRSLLAMSKFNGYVDTCGLMEMRSQGRIMSWCNGNVGSSRSWARLDRALVNINFSTTFGSAFMEYLTRKLFDHCPMVVHLSLPRSSYGPSPFQFQNMWCLHESFFKFVEDVWVQPECSHGLLRLAAKLKKLKVALKTWNKNIFDRVDLTIKAQKEKMEFLDFQLQEAREPKVEAEFLLTKMELAEREAREESRWAKKAKHKWLQEGEQNSRFFHASVNQRWKASVVSSMHLADGTTLATPEEIH